MEALNKLNKTFSFQGLSHILKLSPGSMCIGQVSSLVIFMARYWPIAHPGHICHDSDQSAAARSSCVPAAQLLKCFHDYALTFYKSVWLRSGKLSFCKNFDISFTSFLTHQMFVITFPSRLTSQIFRLRPWKLLKGQVHYSTLAWWYDDADWSVMKFGGHF